MKSADYASSQYITWTPAYIIEEQLYLGQIPPDILAKIIK
jgi:hypothetical protein